jgi:hypothetical protein
MKNATDAFSRCLGELVALRGRERVELAKVVSNFFIRELVVIAAKGGPQAHQAAEAAVDVLTLGVSTLNLAAKGKPEGITAAAGSRVNWPMLVPPTAKGAKEAAAWVSAIGVGSAAMLNVKSRGRGETPEVRWAHNFILRVVVCKHRGWREAAKVHGGPARWWKPLGALPDFDGSEASFKIWEAACWADARTRFPGDILKTHDDWSHLPGGKEHPLGTAVPESRIRSRLGRALRQVLRFTDNFSGKVTGVG